MHYRLHHQSTIDAEYLHSGRPDTVQRHIQPGVSIVSSSPPYAIISKLVPSLNKNSLTHTSSGDRQALTISQRVPRQSCSSEYPQQTGTLIFTSRSSCQLLRITFLREEEARRSVLLPTSIFVYCL